MQATFAKHLEQVLGWESRLCLEPGNLRARTACWAAPMHEGGPADPRSAGSPGTPQSRDLPASAIEDATASELTVYDVSRSMVQHNRDFHRLLRGGVPVAVPGLPRSSAKSARARVIDFDNAPGSNRFLAVRELTLTGIRTPNYNRRADLICFVNGLPLVFIELKAVHKNICEGFDNNLSDYMDESVIAHSLPSQRFPDRLERRSRPLRLHHQRVGALCRVETARRG